MKQQRIAEISEARLLLRWAARDLTPTQRRGIGCILFDTTQREVAAKVGITHGGIYMAQQAALKRMRAELEAVGVRRSADVVSDAWAPTALDEIGAMLPEPIGAGRTGSPRTL